MPVGRRVGGEVAPERDGLLHHPARQRARMRQRGQLGGPALDDDAGVRSCGGAGTWSRAYSPATTSQASRSQHLRQVLRCSRSSSSAARCGSARSSRPRRRRPSAAAPGARARPPRAATRPSARRAGRPASAPGAPPPPAGRRGAVEGERPVVEQPSPSAGRASSHGAIPGERTRSASNDGSRATRGTPSR